MSESDWQDIENDSEWVDLSAGPESQGMGERIARAGLRTLPVIGAMGGGFLGTAGGPIGTVAGAGAGAMAGKSLEDTIEKLAFDDKKSRGDFYSGLAKEGVMGATSEMGGQVIGKGLEKAIPYVESGLGSLGEKIQPIAKRFGARAIGAERGTIKKLGNDAVEEVGDYALKNNLLSPFGSADDMLARNESIMQKSMSDRAGAYQSIDDAGASTFNPLNAAVDAEKSIVGNLNRGYDDTQKLVGVLDPHLSNILSRGESNIPMAEAQSLVESLGRSAKFDTTRGNLGNEVAKDVYFSLRKSLNQAAEEGAEKVGISGLREIIEGSNKTYSTGTKVKGLLDNKFAREQGNKLIGLTDTITGSEALGALGGPKTAALLAVKRGAERFGSQNAALGLNKLSQSLMKSPVMAKAAQENPAVFQLLIQKLEQNSLPTQAFPRAAEDQSQNFNELSDKNAVINKLQGTKYGQVMQNAAQKGDSSFNAAHFVLSQRDPDYRKALEGEK